MSSSPSGSPEEAQRLRDLRLLRQVKDRIDREYAQPLDVEALARGVHISAGHLSREFKKAYGESPYSYLMTRRIERAMRLLRLGEMSVTDVCFEVGCQSLGTFSTRFSELVGMSPSAYKQQASEDLAGVPSCVVKQLARPVGLHRSGMEKHGRPTAPSVLGMDIRIYNASSRTAIATPRSRSTATRSASSSATTWATTACTG